VPPSEKCIVKIQSNALSAGKARAQNFLKRPDEKEKLAMKNARSDARLMGSITKA
jgi:hypothetical protein